MGIEEFKDPRTQASGYPKTVNIRFADPEDLHVIHETRSRLKKELGFEVAWTSLVRGFCKLYLEGKIKVT